MQGVSENIIGVMDMMSVCSLRNLALLVGAVCVLAVGSHAAEVDPFMGDYEGHWQLTDNYESGPLVAQVIALGDGRYRIKFLPTFTVRTKPYAELEAQASGGKVSFSGRMDNPDIRGDIEAVIEGDRIEGRFSGEAYTGDYVRGTFSLRDVVRQSPTLGAEPPDGAVVLFEGEDFDTWISLGGRKGAINITEALGSVQNATAYLHAKIWSPRRRDAKLLLGSDDGVKVWLNDRFVHANNALRGVTTDQDKVPVTLEQGVNELLLKVTNGAGDWGLIARFANQDDKPLRNLNEISPEFQSEKGSNEYLRKNRGFITQWQVAGPFQQGGKGPEALFDVAFAPEKNASETDWEWINANEPDDKRVKWRIVDDAMEIKAGTGSIVTKDKFKDFKLHIEFRTPFMPEARGQGRGNSGVYLQGRYEIQVLDSYGLEGVDNECGGIYKVGRPTVNMCYPPMQWQTYDIDFRGPQFDGNGNMTRGAVVTVVHNGITIHQDLEIEGPTGGALDRNMSEPGGIYLQDHGNPVQFRNVWLVETQ